MNIATRVANGTYRFEELSGRRPGCLFIGRKEKQDIDYLAGRLDFWIRDPLIEGEDRRTEYQGMKIYIVDAETYLGFGMSE